MPLAAEKANGFERLAQIAEALGAERLKQDASSLAERIAEGRFYVACIGQFKRGKSTLLNALVGEDILPVGVIPVTAVPTVVRYGSMKSARVRTSGGDWEPIRANEIEQFVSEDKNPSNVKGVTGVEVFTTSQLLETGMCLVDTPGVGSAFEANTAAAREFIPHIDAAIVVIGADPPISGDELKIVASASEHTQDLLVVLNKADRVSEAEHSEAVAFARRMLEGRLARAVGRIYEISAAEVLSGCPALRDWPALVRALEQLAQHSGRELIRAAGERGLRRIREQLLAIIREEREALLRPIEESERRVETLGRTLSEAEQSISDLTYLFMAEQRRLSESFADRRKAFLRDTLPNAAAELRQGAARLPRSSGPAYRHATMALAQDIARLHLLPWLSAEQAHAETAFRRTAQRFIDIGNDFLSKLAASGISELADMPDALDADGSLRAKSHFYFNQMIRIAQPASPFRHLADLILGVVGSYGPIQRDADRFFEELLEVNSTRVQSDVNDRVTESRQKLESEIRILLREVRGAAQRALTHAREAHKQGKAAVEGILGRLSDFEQEARQLGAI